MNFLYRLPNPFILLPIIYIAVLVGCTQIAKGKHEIANAVDSYCGSMSIEQRTTLRNEINAALAEKGNSIKITCKGDPPN